MRYRLRTLLIALAVGPAAIAGCYIPLQSLELSAPLWAIAGSIALIVGWLVILSLVVHGALSRKMLRNGSASQKSSP